MTKHNNQLPNEHFKKKWQFNVRTWFNQPARKARRQAARAEKAKKVFPRPTAGPLRPVVHGQTIRYNAKKRFGRGFTFEELKEAGIPRKLARTIGIAVDHRRRNRSLESLQENANRLKAYQSKLVVFPRRSRKPKAGDAAAEELKTVTQLKGDVLPIVRSKPALETVTLTPEMKAERAYYRLRLERVNKRLIGVRAKRAAEAEAAEKDKVNLSGDLNFPPLLTTAEEYFCKRGFPDFTLHVGPIHGWRTRARLAVRGSPAAPKLGLFRSRTHIVEDIPGCRIHHPRINEAAMLVRQAMQTCRIHPYDEHSGRGELRYLQFTVSDECPEDLATVQVVLVWNSLPTEQHRTSSLRKLANLLWQQGRLAGQAPLLHSIWANFQPSMTNTILGQDWRLLHGPQHIWQRLGGAAVCLAPGSFAQANTGAMDACLHAIQQSVPLGSRVADLHAGVGTIGLSLAATRQCSLVRFVEINPEGRTPFQESAKRLPAGVHVEYHVTAAGERAQDWLSDIDVVVVDPPRKGLEAALLDALCASPESYLFFPGANHLETLAIFRRSSRS
ncbi:hypothetical protein WJX72_001591 [[Myrmecia] bisecta]|uniref:60S ribosomal protein L13 n=1 Tax=[Myrmecia] bisecta TaxID=41462 RepID=A0AAW1PWL9_9CHLO